MIGLDAHRSRMVSSIYTQRKGEPMEQLISPREAADQIGVSVATIKAWMRRASDPLPSVVVGQSGKFRRIIKDQIAPWLTAEASRSAAIK